MYNICWENTRDLCGSKADLHRELERGEDVLHFRLEDFWPEFAFSDAHLVGEEYHLQGKEQDWCGYKLYH